MSALPARTLRRASVIVGGTQALADKLGVPSLELKCWINGSIVPPLNMFLKAVDIVVGYDPGSGSPADKRLASPRQRTKKRRSA
jgi:hypothetical protein